MHPPPSPAWANFTLMMECTPESSCYYSGYSVSFSTPPRTTHWAGSGGDRATLSHRNVRRCWHRQAPQRRKTFRVLACSRYAVRHWYCKWDSLPDKSTHLTWEKYVISYHVVSYVIKMFFFILWLAKYIMWLTVCIFILLLFWFALLE